MTTVTRKRAPSPALVRGYRTLARKLVQRVARELGITISVYSRADPEAVERAVAVAERVLAALGTSEADEG